MYKKCQTEQSAARQQQVERCLLLEMEQRRYEDITVSELCQKTGVSRKGFYRYFSGKQGVLHALLDHTILNIDTDLRANGFLFSTTELTLFFHFWQEHRSLLDILNRNGLLGELVDRSVAVCMDVYALHHDPEREEGGATGLPERPVFGIPGSDQRIINRELVYSIEFWVSGLTRTMLHWYWDGFPLTPEQMAAAVAPLFLGSAG